MSRHELNGEPPTDARWEIELPIHPTAAGVARRAFVDRYRDRIAPQQLEDAAVIVSELVGHAFVAGPPLRELRLTGDLWDGGGRLTVQDDRRLRGDGRAVLTLGPGTIAHRLVAGLTEAFGELRVDDVTIVWCELPRGEVPAAARTGA